MGCGKARFGREGKKHLKLTILVSKFVPWDHKATRTWDLEATRTDLEAGLNDRKRALPHPRKQRRISLHKLLLLCFLGCGTACFLSLRPASRSVRVASRGVPVARGLIAGCLEVPITFSSCALKGQLGPPWVNEKWSLSPAVPWKVSWKPPISNQKVRSWEHSKMYLPDCIFARSC